MGNEKLVHIIQANIYFFKYPVLFVDSEDEFDH